MSVAIRSVVVAWILFVGFYEICVRGTSIIRDGASISNNSVCTLRLYGTDLYLTAYDQRYSDQTMIIQAKNTTRNNTAAQWIIEKVADTEMVQLRNQKFYNRGYFYPHIPRDGLYLCVFSTIDDCKNPDQYARHCRYPPHFTIQSGTEENTVTVTYPRERFNLTTNITNPVLPPVVAPVWGAHCNTWRDIIYDWIMEC